MEQACVQVRLLSESGVEVQYRNDLAPSTTPLVTLRAQDSVQFSQGHTMFTIKNDPSSANVSISFPRHLFNSSIVFIPVSPEAALRDAVARCVEVTNALPRTSSVRSRTLSKARSISLLDTQEEPQEEMEVTWKEKRPCCTQEQ